MNDVLMVILGILTGAIVVLSMLVHTLMTKVKNLEIAVSEKISYTIFEAERGNRRDINNQVNAILEYFDLDLKSEPSKLSVKRKSNE